MRHARNSSILLLVLFLAFSGLFPAVAAAGPDHAPEFIRFRSSLPGQGTLATSLRHYRHPVSGRVVALVSAVHVADPGYYQALQRHLDSYDLVLFERIGTHGEEDSAAGEVLSQLARLQRKIAGFLEFSHQMDSIDYSRRNLRHADMSLAEFREELRLRGDELAVWQMQVARWIAPLLRMAIGWLDQFDDEQVRVANIVRWQLGKLLGNLDQVLVHLNLGQGDNPDDLIIGVRNRRAWEVLEAALPEGHQRIAIFYGAAHMPDFQRRLLAAGWQLEETRWVTAWRIPIPSAGGRNETPPEPPMQGFDI